MKTKHIIQRLILHKWNKEFVEAGKARLDGDTHRTKNVFKKITALIEKFKGIDGTLLIIKFYFAVSFPLRLVRLNER